MNEQQRITHHGSSTVNHWSKGSVSFGPGGRIASEDTAGHDEVLKSAQREAAQLEMSRQRDRDRSYVRKLTPDMIELKKPELSENHSKRVMDLRGRIYDRGLQFDSAKLVKRGGELFEELCAADRECRTQRVFGTRCDFTSFDSVKHALAASGAIGNIEVPQRSMLARRNPELHALARVDSFACFWKSYPLEPRAIVRLYAFHDTFTQLVMGKSIHSWLEHDGQIHHRSLARGAGEKVNLFEAWLPTLRGKHHRVFIRNAVGTLVHWLSDEKASLPDACSLAKEWCGVRVPSEDQTKLAGAVLDGFLRGLSGWTLWELAGRAIRKPPEQVAIQKWHAELAQRFPRIAQFHRDVAAHFWKPLGGDNHEFEAGLCREFVDRKLEELQEGVADVAALTINENAPADASPVAARFREWILCTGDPKPGTSERVAERLATVFPGARFEVEIS